MEKAQNIRERSFQYALRALNLFQSLESRSGSAGRILSKQYLRAATSVGANLEEAYAAESKRDFLHKCRVSLKEIRECRYWLRLITESGLIQKPQIVDLLNETRELIAILTTIVKNTSRTLEEGG